MEYQYHDGGRAAAGYKDVNTKDCVCRAICIASGRPYQEIYDALAAGNANQRITKRTSKSLAGKKTAANGINTKRKWFRDYMAELGFEWESYARIGSPSRIKLDDSFPCDNVYIAVIGKHYVAVLGNTLYDTYDSRMSRAYFDDEDVLQPPKPRMVYGVWKPIGTPPHVFWPTPEDEAELFETREEKLARFREVQLRVREFYS